MKNAGLNLTSLTKPLKIAGQKIASYKGLLLFLAVAGLYGFIVWRINIYSNIPASEQEETTQSAAQPHINQVTIQKIQSLQDNSVSVQALFDQARGNPFQE